MLKQKGNKAFTLIEILVVILIIVIFVVIIFNAMSGWTDKRDTEKAAFEIIRKIEKN